MKPEDIEALSFAIIEKEAGSHAFDSRQWPVVRRMIHTSADFEYLETTRFHPDAIEAGLHAIRSGKPIFTDTQMAREGIRKQVLSDFGVEVLCLIGDPEVAKIAARNGVTRSRAAVDAAAGRLQGGIYAVGNAPTALLRLVELVHSGAGAPALVIGLPVGFVNAAESKAALWETGVPCITNTGRKGGSNVAAGVVNALVIMAAEEKMHPC